MRTKEINTIINQIKDYQQAYFDVKLSPDENSDKRLQL